ncbi:hypothetical protein RJT34_25692 [Clitoria ternatea]|uniref:Uncharacterized protein n=1 Tax=Clitoria ternatea TaxID=43366 RepID=A0AAN9IIR7_CLITE
MKIRQGAEAHGGFQPGNRNHTESNNDSKLKLPAAKQVVPVYIVKKKVTNKEKETEGLLFTSLAPQNNPLTYKKHYSQADINLRND